MESCKIIGGVLYVVGTPIGNLGDLTLRAIDTLKTVDIIAAEDTRRTRKLLSHLSISKPLMAYHDHNAAKAVPKLLEHLEQGDAVALVTDGGMPCISDPGHSLIAGCKEIGITVTVVPGPSAVTTALALSGLPSERFCFEGYLPRQKSERLRRWEQIAKEPRAVVIYEAPHRMQQFLMEIQTHVPLRSICICREMTKLHEETIRGVASDVAQELLNENGTCVLKGEITVVIANQVIRNEPIEVSELDEALKKAIKECPSHRDASRMIADQFNIPFRKVYKRMLELIKTDVS